MLPTLYTGKYAKQIIADDKNALGEVDGSVYWVKAARNDELLYIMRTKVNALALARQLTRDRNESISVTKMVPAK